MKTQSTNPKPQHWKRMLPCLLAAALMSTWLPVSRAADEDAANETKNAGEINVTKDTLPADQSTGAEITSVHPIPFEPPPVGVPSPEPREVAWLGVATQEAPEVLTSQMNLDPGVGLVITFVAKDSPAAKAGLERNDLLVGFENQSLVLPAQLRKLVQSREEGNEVALTYYRNGKKRKAEITLGKTTLGPWGDAEGWKEQLRGLERQWRDVNMGEAFREPLAQMERKLGDLKINQRDIQEQIRHAVEQARHAANNPEVRAQIQRAMEEARRAMEEARGAMSGIAVPSGPGRPPHAMHSPKVTVRSSGDASQSVVVADDTGTYVIVRNPRLRLTAHDPDGKLLFDGEIETDEQRNAVPPELWEKVKPLLDKLSAERDEPFKPTHEAKSVPSPEMKHDPGTI